MKKNTGIKIMAFLALFGIIIGIVGTGLLIIFGNNTTQNIKQELTPEQIKEIQNMIKTNSGSSINTNTVDSTTKTLTGTTK